MKSVTGFGVVRSGGILISHRTRFDERIAKTFDADEKVMVTVERVTRNLRQNALYWVWCTKIGIHFGCDPEYIHSENKRLFNGKVTVKVDPRTGAITEETFPASTADLSVDAFALFLEKVQRNWTEQGVDLPSPNDDEFTPAPPHT